MEAAPLAADAPPAAEPTAAERFMLDDELIDWIEDMLQRPHTEHDAFTELQLTTAVVATRVTAERMTHQDMVKVIQRVGLTGNVVAVNSNYGGTSQQGYEHLVKRGAKAQPMAPAGRKQRQPEGMGGSINSSVEFIIRTTADSDVGQRLLREKGALREYNVKLFPTTGAIQVPGSVLFDLSDGLWAMRECVRYLERVFGTPVAMPAEHWCDLVNFKFHLRKLSDRQVLNFPAFAAAARDPETAWPAQVNRSSINMESKSFNFVYVRPGDPKQKVKRPRVNMFTQSGKVCLLGCPSVEFGVRVYETLNRLASEQWDRFVALEPFRDDDFMTPRRELEWAFAAQLRAPAPAAQFADDADDTLALFL